MDAATLRNLEIVQTLSTPPRRRCCRCWTAARQPVPRTAGAPQRATTGPCYRRGPAHRSRVTGPRPVGALSTAMPRTSLRGLSDIERSPAIAMASVRPRELAGLRATLATLPALGDTGGLDKPAAATDPRCACRRSTGMPCSRVPSTTGARGARDGGVIASSYDTDLDELRAIQHDSGAFLAAMELRERERTGIPNLRVGIQQGQRLYIEITQSYVAQVPVSTNAGRRSRTLSATSPPN